MKSKIFFLEQEISRRDAVIQEYSKKVEVMSIYEHSLEERDEEIMFLRREVASYSPGTLIICYISYDFLDS